MTNNKTNILALVIAAIALSVSIAVIMALPDTMEVTIVSTPQLGAFGDSNYYTVDAANGYKVNGTVALDSSRNLSAGTGAFTGTLSVTGATAVQEFTQGGGILNIATTSATYTLTAAQMAASNVIEITSMPAGVAIALTLPATSTLTTVIPTAGDMREWIIDNQHLAATTTTITAGTGIDLIAVTVDDDVIDGQEFSRLTCWRKETTDVACIVSELLHAD